jgi:hypothetical protein
VTAGATSRAFSVTVLDSNAVAAVGTWIRLSPTDGVAPDSVQVDANGVATVTWIPPNIADRYTLTGFRSPAASAARIVIQRSVAVIASVAAASKSTLAVNATTIAVSGTATVTVVVKDQFGNVVDTATPAAFVLTPTNGTLGAVTCTLGSCTATFTPTAAGAASISAKIGGTEILFSPIALTITP